MPILIVDVLNARELLTKRAGKLIGGRLSKSIVMEKIGTSIVKGVSKHRPCSYKLDPHNKTRLIVSIGPQYDGIMGSVVWRAVTAPFEWMGEAILNIEGVVHRKLEAKGVAHRLEWKY
mmetsp:Transcript_23058/g.53925  ORF Transcript_23058/g.53925 Transcript_23058/m.53925 type:complete len:118 (-) Transcript_23058:412-765(-)